MNSNNWWAALCSVLVLSLSGGTLAVEKTVSLPPVSLSQWYKPLNERQVWLHTMFRLRREMQAVSEYAALEEPELLARWAARLTADYRRIGEMVPEWQEDLELEWADRLQQATRQADYPAVARAQRRLAGSCRACHREFRAVAAALYRTPDYKGLKVEDSETLDEVPFADAMERLSRLVNRIKIASVDDRPAVALESLAELNRRLGELSTVCAGCHQDSVPQERILGAASLHLTGRLKSALEEGDRKGTGKALGALAVEVCARCHGIHRSLYDLTQAIGE